MYVVAPPLYVVADKVTVLPVEEAFVKIVESSEANNIAREGSNPTCLDRNLNPPAFLVLSVAFGKVLTVVIYPAFVADDLKRIASRSLMFDVFLSFIDFGRIERSPKLSKTNFKRVAYFLPTLSPKNSEMDRNEYGMYVVTLDTSASVAKVAPRVILGSDFSPSV